MPFQLLYKILNEGNDIITNYIIRGAIKAFFDSRKMNFQNFSQKVHFKMHKSMVGILMYLIVLREQACLSQLRPQLQLQQVYALITSFVVFVYLLLVLHVRTWYHFGIREEYFSLPLLESSLNAASEPAQHQF